MRQESLTLKGWFNMKRITAMFIALITVAVLLAGCGSGVSGGFSAAKDSANLAFPTEAPVYPENGYGWYDEMPTTDVEAEEAVDAEYDYNAGAAPSVTAPKETARKIIKNGSLSIETLEFDVFIRELEKCVADFGGYVENSSQYGSATYSSRSASYTVRVPYEKYDEFVSNVGELGTVTSSNHSIDDVTLQYVDIEARLKALETERDSFMDLMSKAETVDEILQIQSYLTDVNYEIESYTSQLNTLKNLVSYSTVNISVSEVQRVTPAEPKTVWERISSNLSNNLYNIGVGFTDLFVAIISSLPYLLILAIIVIIIVVIVLICVKSSRKKQKKMMDEMAKAYQQNGPTEGNK